MSDRYIPNGTPLTPYERELLDILQEEAAEVIQAASKLKRFGKENRPDTGESNSAVLGHEVGDLSEMIERVVDVGLIMRQDVTDGQLRKRARLLKFMQTEAG